MNGENREIHFALAETKKHGIPLHYKPKSSSIPSMSTISAFSKELTDYLIVTILIVIDLGF
jgi:hypothetical protein